MTARYKSHARRHVIAERDGWRCNFCGRETECATCKPDAEIVATIDHIIPRSMGGTDALANLAIACRPCNEAKDNGVWPNLDVRALLPDDFSKPAKMRGWQLKRERLTGVAPTDPPCFPRGDSRRRPKNAFHTEADAAAACVDVEQKTGRRLQPFQCERCQRWHLTPMRRQPADLGEVSA